MCVAGRAHHGDGPQSPPLPVGLHPEHHQRGTLGGPHLSQVGSRHFRTRRFQMLINKNELAQSQLIKPFGSGAQRRQVVVFGYLGDLAES